MRVPDSGRDVRLGIVDVAEPFIAPSYGRIRRWDHLHDPARAARADGVGSQVAFDDGLGLEEAPVDAVAEIAFRVLAEMVVVSFVVDRANRLCAGGLSSDNAKRGERKDQRQAARWLLHNCWRAARALTKATNMYALAGL